MNNESIEKKILLPKIAAVIPTYNNGGTLAAVIAGVRMFLDSIIVVNDGSTDGTKEILSKTEGVQAKHFEQNCGKGCALKAGFLRAVELGYTHVITIDADGQHCADDIPLFLEKIMHQPEAVWIGNRIPYAEKGVTPPKRSSFGRKFGNFWFNFNTAIRLNDTQCGFRAYPLASILSLKCPGKHYEYEQEVIIKAAWNGVPVKEIPVKQYYFPREKAVSHFRPFVDFMRIGRVNSIAAVKRVFNPINALDIEGKTWREKIVTVVKHELTSNISPGKAAFSLAFGVFLAIFPIHGIQILTLMVVSVVWQLNRPLAFLGLLVSSPPTLPLIVIAAVAIGRLFLPSDLIVIEGMKTAQIIAKYALQFIVGSVVLSIVSGVATYIIALPFFRRIASRRSNKKG